MRWLLAVAFFVLCSKASIAAPIVVQSGEHGEFTRLVVYVPNSHSWEVTSERGITHLKVPEWEDGFDVSRVFKKINTDRIGSVGSTQRVLTLTLNCDCEVETLALPQGFVQLDFSENQVRKPQPRPLISKNVSEIEVLESSPQQVEASPEIWEISPLEIDFNILEQVALEGNTRQVGAFSQNLVEGISRGATLDHLSKEESRRDFVANSRATLIPGLSDDQDLFNMLSNRARISDASGEQRENAKQDESTYCELAQHLKVRSWGQSEDFSTRLSELRNNLLDGVGVEVEQSKIALAKHYVYFGLIPEAVLLIAAIADNPDTMAMKIVVNALNKESVKNETGSKNFEECDDQPFFWLTLNDGVGDQLSDDAAKRLIDTFKALPLHLQSLTADKLFRILTENDHLTAAGVLKNVLKRQLDDGEESIGGGLGLSSLDSLGLRQRITSNGLDAPAAMIELLNRAIKKDLSVSSAEIELAEAFAFQLDGTSQSMELKSSIVLALATDGDAKHAIEVYLGNLAELRKEVSGTEEKLATILLSQKKIKELAELVWKIKSRNLGLKLDPDVILEVAKEFLAAGLPQLASVTLENVVLSSEVKVVRSKTLAADGNFESAIAELAGLEDQEARDLYLSHLTRVSPYKAWAENQQLTPEKRSSLAWETGNWNAVEIDENRTRIAEILTTDEPNADDWSKPIATARALEIQSVSARAEIERLLFSE